MNHNSNASCDETTVRTALFWVSTNSVGSNLCELIDSKICSEFFNQNYSLHLPISPKLNDPPVFAPSNAEKWGLGLLFTCIVCSCAALGACFSPLMNKSIFGDILTWMVAMGVGCLSGTAIFHLIPQCFEISSETSEHVDAYLHKAAVIMSAIYVFYLAERLFKMILEHRQISESSLRKSSGTGNKCEAALASPCRRASILHFPKYHSVESLNRDSHAPPKQRSLLDINEIEDVDPQARVNGNESKETGKKGINHHHHHHPHERSAALPAVAWMILTGDSFVDGLSIGAAFSVSVLRGISISLAVFCEELPHELGDMAILISSGLSLRRAVTYNCLTGLSCFAGFAVGVMLGDLPAASSWIFAVAGGMFLYISLVNMVPEMIAVVEEAGREQIKKGLVVLFVQNTGLLFGLVLMYLLARFSHQIQLG